MIPEEIDLRNATPEQKKEISKILSQARLKTVWIGVKFSFGFFFSNVVAFLIGFWFLKDGDPDSLGSFQFIAVCANFIFMMIYLHRRLHANGVIVLSKIKEVLKNKTNIDGE